MNNYPTDEDLTRIREWDAFDVPGLLAFLSEIWWMPDMGFKAQKNCRKWELHTLGWSGNEDIIEALRQNKNLWWAVYWRRSERGGHYYFDTKMVANKCQPKAKS